MSARYHPCLQSLGASTLSKIHSSRILVVGAGGIGCELLKNLALMGFLNIEIIDLDTIDVSNLNRQFLFRPEHVGKPKAIVAAEAARLFNPSINIISHHGNVKSEEFGIDYISSFNLVLNALDNIDARRHVNRLCLAAQVPLIDSGTTGYNGQVMPIVKQKTACYECSPKPSPKVYPICTIRSTPDKPVHCIVWAKGCFTLLFGNAKDSLLWEDSSTGEPSCYMQLITFPKVITPKSIVEFGATLIEALYIHEINKQIEMGTYKVAKKVPVPLTREAIAAGSAMALKYIESLAHSGGGSPATKPSSGSGWDMRSWTSIESVAEFIICIWEAWHPSGGECNGDMIGKLAFDKDDNMAMRFVSASSNLRSSIFDIPIQSFHDAKGIAGNIIPAIATTNAIVASVQVMHAIKILAAQSDASGSVDPTQFPSLPHTYCRRKPTGKGVYLQPTSADAPNPACYVCSKSLLTLQIDTSVYTFGDFINKIVKSKLGFNQPMIVLGSSIIYEEDEDSEEDLQRYFSTALDKAPGGGVVNGSTVSFVDLSQKLEVSIVIKHVPASTFADLEDEDAAKADNFIISGELKSSEGSNDDSTSVSGAGAEGAASLSGIKRSASPIASQSSDSSEAVNSSKRPATTAIFDDDIIDLL